MGYVIDFNLAVEYGVEEALIIGVLQLSIMDNKVRKENFHNGRYYEEINDRLLKSMFPFWQPRKAKRLINKLIDKGVLVVGRMGFKTLVAFNDEKTFLN